MVVGPVETLIYYYINMQHTYTIFSMSQNTTKNSHFSAEIGALCRISGHATIHNFIIAKLV